MIKKLIDHLLDPIKQIKLRYVPLMLIYAAYAASAVTGIADMFYIKKELTISAEGLILLGSLSTIPWTCKFILGNAVDSISIFGSQRKAYIILGSILMFASYILLGSLASGFQWVTYLGDKNSIYTICCIALSTAFCAQNVVSETMSTEVILRHDTDGNLLPKEEIDKELVLVQYLVRLSFAFTSLLVAGLAGFLASHFSYGTVFFSGLVIPFISLLGISLIHLDSVEEQPINWKILGAGVVFAIFVIFIGLSGITFKQEIIFLVSISIVCILLCIVCKDMDYVSKKTIALAGLVIFVYQGTPSGGPGISWWQMDQLHFDESFYGTLSQLGAFVSLIGMWILNKWIKNKQVGFILLFLSGLGFVLSLPTIGIAYGMGDWTMKTFGFGAKTITLLDVALASPFELITTVSLLALVASHAPKGKAGIFFALMTSWMNLSLNFSSLMTKYLYKIYPVVRGDYSNIKQILISSTIISFLVPTIVIMLVMNPWKKAQI